MLAVKRICADLVQAILRVTIVQIALDLWSRSMDRSDRANGATMRLKASSSISPLVNGVISAVKDPLNMWSQSPSSRPYYRVFYRVLAFLATSRPPMPRYRRIWRHPAA